jgi:arylsulfatase A-like enzyme
VRSVVLVTIDTWRRDATGFLGGLDPSPTPFVDSLAEKGLVAADAVAPVPLTGPSHWSMLTGRWPWLQGVRLNGDTPSEDFGPTLAETLRGHGWSTGAFVSCAALDHRFGFARGFDVYDDRFRVRGEMGFEDMPQRRGDATVDRALAWTAGLDPTTPLFLWVHLFEPHYPYDSPRGQWAGRHGDYLAEVAFADDQLRRLSTGLEQQGRPQRESLWVVLSDHGEGLGEHGEPTHGLLLHGATTRIPLLLAGPGVPARRDDELASTVDVLPTVLALLRLKGIGRSAAGGRRT